MSRYFKVTNAKERHHGYQYHNGLNILLEPFNDDSKISCVPGGFYFTTLEHITYFYGYGINLREVILPESDPEFKMVKDPTGNKWRANRIILGEKYSLYEPATYKKFGLNILDNDELINQASSNGHIDILNWWKSSNLKLKYGTCAINIASHNGHINVLNWWKSSGLGLKYSDDAMDDASINGHINVLEWWKSSRLPLKYTTDSMDFASRCGHLNVLDWWKSSGLELKFTTDAMEVPLCHDFSNVLDWWKSSGLMKI